MTRYEIYTDNFELRFGRSQDSIPTMTAQEIFDQYLRGSANDPTLRESFDDLETAKATFSQVYANGGTTHAEASVVFWLLTGNVAYLEENSYDDDGDFDQGGDIYVYSAEGYAKPDDE